MLGLAKHNRLVYLLESAQSEGKQGGLHTEESLGELIEILKNIRYFRAEIDLYGLEVLPLYIGIIEPYILREGMRIIDFSYEYVILEGRIEVNRNDGVLVHVYTEGMIIDPGEQSEKMDEFRKIYTAVEGDCGLIRLLSRSKNPKVKKHCLDLRKFQKERILKKKELDKLVSTEEERLKCREKLKEFEFFNKISDYDLNDILSEGKILKVNKGTVLHSFGDCVSNLGFILSGQVKLEKPVLNESELIKEPGKIILEKYKLNKKEKGSSILSFLEAGEWIGLEEHFSKQNFLSKIQVISHDAWIIYVNTELFQSRFNETLTYFLISNTKEMMEKKQKLQKKVMETKREKEMEIYQEKNRLHALKRFKEKLGDKRSSSSMSNQEKSKPILRSETKQRMKVILEEIDCKENFLNEDLVHKVHVNEYKYGSLPKVERTNLFPELYEKAAIPGDLQEEFKKVNYSKSLTKRKEIKAFKFLQADKLYERVIFDSLMSKMMNPERERSRAKSVSRFRKTGSKELSANSSNISAQELKEMMALEMNHKNRIWFNQSIHNNFKIHKKELKRGKEHLSRTLEII